MKRTIEDLSPRDYDNMKQLHLDPSEYLRRRKITNRGGKLLLSAGLAYATLAWGQHSDAKAERHYDKIEQATLRKVEDAYNDVMVFYPGVKYRIAPEIVDHNASEGPDTVAGVIPAGKVLRVDRALKYEDKEGSGDFWIAFVEQGDIGSKPTNLEGRTFWINLSELQREANQANKNLYEVFDYNTGETDGGPADSWRVTIDQRGRVLGDINGHGGPVGVPQFVSETDFTRMVSEEQLSLSHGK